MMPNYVLDATFALFCAITGELALLGGRRRTALLLFILSAIWIVWGFGDMLAS